MIDQTLNKVLLYIGHVLWFESHNLRMSEVMKQYTGGTLVITMDYMMKYEETYARDSSHEHHGKRGIVIHRDLAKCKNNDNDLFKRVYCMSLEGDGSQDAKSALAKLDIMCKCTKQEQIWNNMQNIITLCDNAST